MGTIEKIAYRPHEAAEAIGISRRMVDTLIASGELPSGKIGTCRVVSREALERFIRDRMNDKPTE